MSIFSEAVKRKMRDINQTLLKKFTEESNQPIADAAITSDDFNELMESARQQAENMYIIVTKFYNNISETNIDPRAYSLAPMVLFDYNKFVRFCLDASKEKDIRTSLYTNINMLLPVLKETIKATSTIRKIKQAEHLSSERGKEQSKFLVLAEVIFRTIMNKINNVDITQISIKDIYSESKSLYDISSFSEREIFKIFTDETLPLTEEAKANLNRLLGTKRMEREEREEEEREMEKERIEMEERKRVEEEKKSKDLEKIKELEQEIRNKVNLMPRGELKGVSNKLVSTFSEAVNKYREGTVDNRVLTTLKNELDDKAEELKAKYRGINRKNYEESIYTLKEMVNTLRYIIELEKLKK